MERTDLLLELQTDRITDGRTGVKQYAPQLILGGGA